MNTDFIGRTFSAIPRGKFLFPELDIRNSLNF